MSNTNNRHSHSDDSQVASPSEGSRHAISRHRYEQVLRRTLTVSNVTDITPRMRRITLTSPALEGFQSLGADDHIKLFFASDAGNSEARRSFTPRAYDEERKTLTLDFALHNKGPATEWAGAARVGSTLEIGGPRGSSIVPDDFDWYLFIGDESALPAIGRWVENLRADVAVTTAVAIADKDEIQTFSTQAAWQPIWVFRGAPDEEDGELLIDALSNFTLPQGEGYIWIAGERQFARKLRQHFVEEGQHPEQWLKASDYWSLTDDE